MIGLVGLRSVRCVEHVACCGDKKSSRDVLQTPEGKRALGILWVDGDVIKMGSSESSVNARGGFRMGITDRLLQ